MSMSIEAFRQLPADEQLTVLAARRQQVEAALQAAAREAGLTEDLEATLVPSIKFKQEMALPAIPNRDEAVRQLMRADSTIQEVHTADVIYKR